ncbi:MAG: adenylate kinase family protein [Verrucomicrobiales bacterium]|nr:nucleoside monophosphate kinase [Verrucomicrobiota bacterium JB025]
MLGPSAAGKGTQGRRLAAAFNLEYLSTGALLREEMSRQSELGEFARPILARGGYLPDDLMCRMIDSWLATHQGGWVLDGFPRSLPQLEWLDRKLAGLGQSLDAAVSIEVPAEQLLARILARVECPACRWSGDRSQTDNGTCPACRAATRQRADDTEENFRQRIVEFERLTQAVVARYAEMGILVRIDGTSCPDKVAERILSHFNP